MKRVCDVGAALVLVFACTTRLNAQASSTPEETRPLVLTEAIPLENIKGRFDHFATSGRKLFVSALGNNTVEVIDISGRTLEHTITGVPNPQGVVYAPEANKLFVASSKGKLYIYDGTPFDLITAIDFHGDVDNLRYDAANERVYVGYGDEETAAIGAVDATTNKRIEEEYKLGAHPESFQLETSGPNIYVNLPDLKQIAVINRTTHAITGYSLARTNQHAWLCSTRSRVTWSPRFPAFRTPMTCTMTPRANGFTWQAEKVLSTRFNKRIQTSTSSWPRFLRR